MSADTVKGRNEHLVGGSTKGAAPEAAGAALWAHGGHGRSPTLQFPHTVDDRLMVATHSSFLPLRAMLHRNGDTMVVFSEEVHETKLRPAHATRAALVRSNPDDDASGGASSSSFVVSRSFVVTTKHVYMMTMPSKGIFGAASTGGCFQLAELSRVCLVRGAAHVILQFVNGVVAIQTNTPQDAARIGDVLFSASGVAAETLDDEEQGRLASAGAVHFSREATKYAASVAPSAAASARSATSRRTTGQTPSAVGMGSDTASSKGVESVLRDILRSNANGDVGSMYPEVGCQTDPAPLVDACLGTTMHALQDRATSPIATMLFNGKATPVTHSGHRTGGNGGGGGGGGLRSGAASVVAADPYRGMSLDDGTESERTASTNNSDFDPSDAVWKSLRRVAPTPHNATHGPKGGSSSAKSVSPLLKHKSSSMSRTSAKDDLRLEDASRRRDESSSSPHQLPKVHATSVGATVGARTSGNAVAEESSGQLEAFLGVLSVYMPGLAKSGIDSITKLTALHEGEVDALLDAAGVQKQGHRMLMHSKISLHRNQQGQPPPQQHGGGAQPGRRGA